VRRPPHCNITLECADGKSYNNLHCNLHNYINSLNSIRFKWSLKRKMFTVTTILMGPIPEEL
jgi:hypothetical protein